MRFLGTGTKRPSLPAPSLEVLLGGEQILERSRPGAALRVRRQQREHIPVAPFLTGEELHHRNSGSTRMRKIVIHLRTFDVF